MKTILYRFLVFFFCSSISFFAFSESAIDEIYRRCGIIETSCSDIVRVTGSAINKIENQTYTYNEYVNGSNVTRTVRLKEIGGFGHTVEELQRIYNNAVDISNQSGLIRQLATQLSSSGGGGSYDDTDLMAELDELERHLSNIESIVDLIETDLYPYLEKFFKPLYDGLGHITNSLPSVSFYTYFTNKVSHSRASNTAYTASLLAFRYNFDSQRWAQPIYRLSSLNPYYKTTNAVDIDKLKSLNDYLLLLAYNQMAYDGGILTTLYTNTLNTFSFHRDYQKDFKSYSDFTTNKIHEIVSIFNTTSPLDRITEDSNPSNIYNFVTNYYIKVSTNPSGSADENHTNWFNRVEMLLAALVFRPQEVAPSNDFSNVKDNEKKQFEDSIKDFLDNDIGDIQQNSENVLSDFEKTKTSLLSFFSHLNNSFSSLASIPSHIEFFQIDTSNGVTRVEISTQGTLATFADTLRAITTLCWISFFIVTSFLLSRWLFIKFSSILKFCYSVFKTLIGIG